MRTIPLHLIAFALAVSNFISSASTDSEIRSSMLNTAGWMMIGFGLVLLCLKRLIESNTATQPAPADNDVT